MLVGDIDEPVVAAAARTPFEARRRVFVIERAETMNEQSQNKMLKTLEEPASFAHLILLSSRPGKLLPTISSRCQLVRFDAPEPDADRRAPRRRPRARPGRRRRRRPARPRRRRAAPLDRDARLRAARRGATRAPRCAATSPSGRGWRCSREARKAGRPRAGGGRGARRGRARAAAQARAPPRRARGRRGRQARAAPRAHGRARPGRSSSPGLWFRDVACVADGAADLVHATDRLGALEEDAKGRSAHRLWSAVALVDESRAAFILYPNEELLLEALASRLARAAPAEE